MAVAVVGLSIGIVSTLMLPVMPSGVIGIGLFVAATIAGRARLRFVAAVMIGASLALLEGGAALAHRFDPGQEKRDVVVEGVIEQVTSVRPDRIGFILAVPPGARPADVPTRMRLSWYHPPSPPKAGDVWRVRVRLREPRGVSNPGGFDFERWLLASRIGAVGYVRADPGNTRVDADVGWRTRARRRISEAVVLAAGRDRAGAVLTALIAGGRTGLSPQTRQLLLESGTAHLLAISGLHVGIAAGSGALVGRLAWRACAGLLAGAASTWVGLASLLTASVYAAIAGLSVATQRALVMIATVIALSLLRRTAPIGRGLVVAAAVILILDPLAPLDGGFWLSFVAVGILGLRFAGLTGRRGASSLVPAQIALSIGMVVPTVMIFGFVSAVGPIVNLFAVPFVTLFVLPLGLLGGFASLVWGSVSGWLLATSAEGIRLLFAVIERLLVVFPGALEVADSPVVAKLCAALAGVALLLPRPVPGRCVAPALLVPILFWQAAAPAAGEFELTVLDVGQGLSAVVRTRRHALVFDAGPAWPGGDAGASTVRPYLRRQGIRRIDGLVLSHGDLDHVGGGGSLAPIVEGFALVGPGTEWPWGPSRTCRAGQRWHWDGVEFRILHPASLTRYRRNDASCVLQVRSVGGSALLTGDIEAAAERALVRRYPEIESDVVLAPHHGSATSSSTDLVAATRPEWVVFAVGHRNRWAFPREEVLARWRSAGAVPMLTSVTGALLFRFGQDGIHRGPAGWRCAAPRFWRPADCPAQ
jgi:competence protein ComEC